MGLESVRSICGYWIMWIGERTWGQRSGTEVDQFWGIL